MSAAALAGCRRGSVAGARPALLAVALLLAACRGEAPPPPPAPLALDVWFSGCAAVRRGPVCAPPADRKLRVWIAGRAAATFEGGRADAGVEVGDGRRYEVELAPDAPALRVVVEVDGRRGEWTLPLAAQAPLPVADEAAALRKAGRLEDAERLLRAALPGADTEAAARLTSLLARVVLARGDADAALTLLDDAAARHAALGRLSDARDDTHAAAFVRSSQLRRFAEARATLARTWGEPREYPDGVVRQAYYEGLLAKNTGDVRTALAKLREAAALAERTGLRRIRAPSHIGMASALRILGRFDEALALLDEVATEAQAARDACYRATALTNLGWVAVLASEAAADGPTFLASAPTRRAPARARGVSHGEAPDPTVRLEPLRPLAEALSLFGTGCRDVHRASLTRIHLALAALQAGDLASAREQHRLAAAEAPSDAPNMRQWLALVEARIAHLSGQAEAALAIYGHLDARAEVSLAPEVAWRARVGAGEALMSLGRTDAAIAAWARAEALLEDRVSQMPLADGRDSFVGSYETGARLLVGALVARGRDVEAFAAARRARSRVLAGLHRADRLERLSPDERRRWDEAIARYERERAALDEASAGDWRLPQDELDRARARRGERLQRLRAALDEAFAVLGADGDAAAPPPLDLDEGELALLFHPSEGGWIGFSATRDGVKARPLPVRARTAEGPEATAAVLLAPFATEIAAARRIRLLPYGELRAVDVHALPFGAGRLVDHATIVHALDLPGRRPTTDGAASSALVVADPRADLPAARAEADGVAAALAGRLEVRRLTGAAADASAFRAGVARADLLHYAGHGVFGGWASELPLANGGGLAVGDILALRRVPRIVVLSGCETAASSRDVGAETVGLAQAFVAAGATTAIAASRAVDDEDAARLMAHFYSALAEEQPAQALRRAQIALRAERPGADWAAFRVIVP